LALERYRRQKAEGSLEPGIAPAEARRLLNL
jgi:hypothetical protein